MKKRINGKVNKSKKNFITFIVVSLFFLFFSLALIFSDRNFLFIESKLHELSSMVNKYFINHLYSDNNFKNNIISSKVDYLQYENNALRGALSLKEENTNYIICEVVNHTSFHFLNKIDVSKGYKDNIKKGFAVVNSNGLIGFISKTSKNISEVELLTSVNENKMISVVIEDENEKIAGVLSDYDQDKEMFKVSEVITKKESLKGLHVSLSGYNNETYKGIYVGTVEDEQISNYGLSKTVWVKSDVSFDDLLFVAVVGSK